MTAETTSLVDSDVQHSYLSFRTVLHLLHCGSLGVMLKHWMIAARAGNQDSLDNIRRGFMNGMVTKEEYERTLRAYKESVDEMKSDQRDKVGEYRD